MATLIAIGAVGAVSAQAPDARVTLEPSRATVGDRLTLTIVLLHDDGATVAGPTAPDAFAPLELVEALPPETREAEDGRIETQLAYVLTAFRTGEARPPLLRVTIDGTPFDLLVPAVTIESVLPPGGAGPRDVSGPLAASASTPSWVWAALTMAGFAGLSGATMALARLPLSERPPRLVTPPGETPEVAARRELDALAGEGLIERGDLKAYYQRLGACLRRYLAARFDLPATAMTPGELARRLEEIEAGRWPARLAANLLEQCEAVQFAQYQPARERAEADLATAGEVITLASAPTLPAGEAQP